MNRPIYLDYASTTPVDPRVAAVMAGCLTKEGVFGNPSSCTHIYGWEARERVEQARTQLATLLNCQPKELIFTSGATEANNLALKGLYFGSSSKKHLITLTTEHKSVLQTCRFLQSEHGAEVTFLNPMRNGRLDLAVLEAALRPDTLLVSVMQVNNEIGVIQDLSAIGALVHQHGALLHVDAAQSVGKLPIDLRTLPIDLLSLSGHKIYGPKGVGALYLREGLPCALQPLIHGGGHESGLRSGTLPTHQIVGLGEAARILHESLPEESTTLARLRDRLWAGLSQIPGVVRHGCPDYSAPHILNLSFPPLGAELLIESLPDLAFSRGSACNSESSNGSFVIESLGVPRVEAQGAVRFSLGRYTTEAEIDRALELLLETVQRLQTASPGLWST